MTSAPAKANAERALVAECAVVTAPASGSWLDDLRRCGSVEELGTALALRNPQLAPHRLKRLAILGAASEGWRLAALCDRHGIEVVTLCDDNPNLHALEHGGHRVVPTAALDALDRELPVVVASHRILEPMARLRALGFGQVAAFALLQVLDPERFPPHMFYAGLLEDLFDNRERYSWLHDVLTDDASRQVLVAAIGFRLTLEPELLRPVIDSDLYAPKGLSRLDGDEVYVDAGAYDGDSIRWFIERSGRRFSRILAFEPDPKTYARLEANFADDPRIETFNQGLHGEAAVLRFDDAGARGSAFADEGAARVPVVALDEVVGGERVDLIKMNIEGAELDALHGARRTIARWSPRLAVSAYHRPSDLWRVPELIRELRPGCALYLRQHDGGIVETVAYAV